MPKNKHAPLWSSKRRECFFERVQNRYALLLRLDGRLVRIEVCPDELTARQRAADWRVMYCALDALSGDHPAPWREHQMGTSAPSNVFGNRDERDQDAEHN